MMSKNREKIIASLKSVLSTEISDCLLFFDSASKVSTHGIPRIIINRRGRAVATCYSAGEFRQLDIAEGTWCYCSATGYLQHESKYPNESISVCFYGNYIRAMHITYDGEHQPPTDADLFLNAGIDLPSPGGQLIAMLDDLATSGDDQAIAPYLLKALLKVAIDAMYAYHAAKKAKNTGEMKKQKGIFEKHSKYFR